jgi:hypothetical protein
MFHIQRDVDLIRLHRQAFIAAHCGRQIFNPYSLNSFPRF